MNLDNKLVINIKFGVIVDEYNKLPIKLL